MDLFIPAFVLIGYTIPSSSLKSALMMLYLSGDDLHFHLQLL